MLFILTAVLCLSALMVSPGCHVLTGADYWPMAEGNLWRYRSVAIDVQPDSVPDTVISEDAMTWVTRQETLDNGMKVWAVYASTGYPMYFRESPGAVLQYDAPAVTDPDTFLVLPLAEGKTWHYSGGTMAVREKGTVDVPAGTYGDCWKVEMLGVGPETSLWLGPNLGMVLSEQRYDVQGHTYVLRYELTYKSIK